MGRKVGCEPQMPRISIRQTNRENFPATTIHEYYQRSLIIPFIDHLLEEMKSRFSESQKLAFNGLYLIPEIIESTKDWKAKIKSYSNILQDDLPCIDMISTELDLWEVKWRNTIVKPATIYETMKETNK